MPKLDALIASTLAHTTGSYLALHTGDPGPDGTANEVSGAGYAREPGTYTISGNVATLDSDLTFGPAGAAWGTVTHVTIRDSGGVGLWSGALTAPVQVALGDELIFRSGNLTVQET